MLDGFRTACEVFLTAIRVLSDRGADAFLTTALEEELISFTTFLRKSLTTTEVRRTLVTEANIGPLAARKTLVGLPAEAETGPEVGLNLFVFRITPRVEKLVAAPLLSEAFEQRMVADLTRLKAFIKEVTLGAHMAALRE